VAAGAGATNRTAGPARRVQQRCHTAQTHNHTSHAVHTTGRTAAHRSHTVPQALQPRNHATMQTPPTRSQPTRLRFASLEQGAQGPHLPSTISPRERGSEAQSHGQWKLHRTRVMRNAPVPADGRLHQTHFCALPLLLPFRIVSTLEGIKGKIRQNRGVTVSRSIPDCLLYHRRRRRRGSRLDRS